jgi:hypothetical protein
MSTKGRKKAKLSALPLQAISADATGTLRVGDSNSGVSLMAIGPGETVLTSSLSAKARGFALSGASPFISEQPSPLQDGDGTVLARTLTFDLPCMNGTWHVALIRNADAPAGLMLWHDSLVGSKCESAAQLVAQMEDAGAGVICNDATDALNALDIVLVGRYDWSAGDPAHPTHKFGETHSAVLRRGFGEDFHFLPPRVVLDRVWPWLDQAAATCDPDDFDSDTVDAFPAGLHLLSAPAPVGAMCSIAAEYGFARVWMHRAGGQLAGAKAIMWYTYNMGDVFAGHKLGDVAIPGPSAAERLARELQQEEIEDPTWTEADESDSLDDDIAVQLSEGELEALAAEAAEALADPAQFST